MDLPSSIPTEKAILSLCLVDPVSAHQAMGELRATDFADSRHRLIFQAIGAVIQRGATSDVVTVIHELGVASTSINGYVPYVSSLLDEIVTPGSFGNYVEILRDCASRRLLIREAQSIILDASEGRLSASEAVSAATDRVLSVAREGERGMGGLVHLFGAVRAAVRESEEVDGKEVTGVPSGIEPLDRITQGFHPGNLIYVGGRPGSGKTSLVFQLSRHAAFRLGLSVAFFSIEMTRRELAGRLVSSEASVDFGRFRSGHLSTVEWKRVHKVEAQAANANVYVDEEGVTVSQIMSRCKRMRAEVGLNLIVVDYIQLMRDTNRHENRNLEVGYISGELKQLSKAMDVPVVVASQLSRAVETRGKNAKPKSSDLRESGSLEQDADLVIFVHSDEDGRGGEREIIVGKNRNGPMGTVPVLFNGSTTSFRVRDSDE